LEEERKTWEMCGILLGIFAWKMLKLTNKKGGKKIVVPLLSKHLLAPFSKFQFQTLLDVVDFSCRLAQLLQLMGLQLLANDEVDAIRAENCGQ
jgi:hypothetical protein